MIEIKSKMKDQLSAIRKPFSGYYKAVKARQYLLDQLTNEQIDNIIRNNRVIYKPNEK